MNTLLRRQNMIHPLPMLMLLAALALTPGAQAQERGNPGNEITGIDYTVQQGGKVVVKVGLKQALQTPQLALPSTTRRASRSTLLTPSTSGAKTVSALMKGRYAASVLRNPVDAPA